MESHEARPADTTLPILRISHPDGKEVWIRESLSILLHFEELFPSTDGWPDLRGETPEARAHTSDVLSLLSDAIHWSLVALINSDSKTTAWSGLGEMGMSDSAAEHGKGRWQLYLDRLELWLQNDDRRAIERDSIAGMVLLAQFEYHEVIYDADWIEGHILLRKWVEGMKEEAWYVESRALKDVEKGLGWEIVLGN